MDSDNLCPTSTNYNRKAESRHLLLLVRHYSSRSAYVATVLISETKRSFLSASTKLKIWRRITHPHLHPHPHRIPAVYPKPSANLSRFGVRFNKISMTPTTNFRGFLIPSQFGVFFPFCPLGT